MCAYNATLLGFNESCRNSYGTTTGTCAPGLYCDSRYAWPAPPLYTCQYVGAVGELCASFVGGRSCASGLVCVPANSTAGTCAPYNSLPNGAAFYIPYLSSILSVTNGRDYCISGLAVPVANTSTGYPAPYGRCVAVLDLTHAGEPCDQCAWVSIPGSSWYFNDKLIALLPVYGDGSLVCAPTTMNSSLHPCVLLPSSITPMEFLSTYMPYAQCYHASTGPAGTPCNLNGNGACSLFACFGTLMSFYSSLLSGGINNYLDRFWARYSPDIQSPSSSCTGSDIDTLIAYAGQMDYTAACGLPPAFAAVGWTCPQASHSPGPSMASPSAPPTFGQSTSRTPTPSMTPLPGLAVVQASSGDCCRSRGAHECSRTCHAVGCCFSPLQVQFTITFSGAGPSLNASAFTSPSTAYMLRLGIACFAHIPVANVTIAAVVVSVDGVSKVRKLRGI